MEQNMFYEWNGIGPIFFSGIGPKAKAIGHSCIYCTLKQQATWHECKVLEGQSYQPCLTTFLQSSDATSILSSYDFIQLKMEWSCIGTFSSNTWFKFGAKNFTISNKRLIRLPESTRIKELLSKQNKTFCSNIKETKSPFSHWAK